MNGNKNNILPGSEIVPDDSTNIETVQSKKVESNITETRDKVAQVEDHAKLRTFEDVISAYEFNNVLKNKSLLTIRDMLVYKNTDKAVKQKVIQELLRMYLDETNIGQERNEPGRKTPGYCSLEFLQKTYNLIQAYADYFGELTDKSVYLSFLKSIADEAERPFKYFINKDHDEPLWYANHLEGYLELLKKIDPVVKVENLQKYPEEAKKFIADIIYWKIERSFFETTETDNRNKTEILELAHKQGIKLPSEKEIWERDVNISANKLSSLVSALEEQAKSTFLISSPKDIEEELDFLEKALEKFAEIKLRDSTDIVNFISNVKKRIEAARNFNLNVVTEIKLRNLISAIESEDEKRLQSELWKSEDFFSRLEGRNLTEFIKKISDFKKEKVDNKIIAITKEVAEDLAKAKELGLKLTVYGKLRAILEKFIAEHAIT
ncbi:hypothetical protein HZA39_00800 [Candidatus Peregrinibacteria bacterium]|nr:hypothetical protein [Candidatus Peregrinibacteria bacterium]